MTVVVSLRGRGRRGRLRAQDRASRPAAQTPRRRSACAAGRSGRRGRPRPPAHVDPSGARNQAARRGDAAWQIAGRPEAAGRV